MSLANVDRLPLLRKDPGFVGASIAALPDQLRDAWRQAQQLRLPKDYRRVTSVVICAMGGSHLGSDILASVFADRLKVPVTLVSDYTLPANVGPETLVMCSSYSGGTEETLAAVKAAKQRRAKILIVTGGGALARQAKQLRLPAFVYKPNFNPSGQPRLGVAYSLMGMLVAWRQLGLLAVSKTEIESMIAAAAAAGKRYGVTRVAKSNQAKKLAYSLSGMIPLYFGAEWTAGNIRTWTNQTHENAKTFAYGQLLPELNHHLLEGLRNKHVTKQMFAVMIRDVEYHPRNLRRLTLTAKILSDLGATVATFTPQGKTKIAKAIDLLTFGSYASWYLAAVRKVQPAPIPTVDALKAALARS